MTSEHAASLTEKLEAGANESAEHLENDNLKKDSNGIVLVPQPSDSPHDPLNWPMWRKHCALAALSYGSLVCYVTGTIIASGVGPIAESLDVSYSKAVYVLTTPVINMYYRHQLGKMIGINTILLVISPFIGGIIGGPVIQNLGWRWSQWISGILMGAAFVAYLFLVPETIYDRDSTGVQKPWFGFLTPKHRHGKSFLFVLTRPFVMFAYPAVTLPCLWFGLAYMPHVGITSVISLIFEAPPYNFSIVQAGLTFFSGLIDIFGVEIMTTVVQTYLVECYHEQAMEASLVLNFFRNILSFITPFFLKDWIHSSGATLPFGIFSLIAVVTFFPLSACLTNATIYVRDQRDIGVAGDLASSNRAAICAVLVAVCMTVLTSRLITTTASSVPPALVVVGLPASSVSNFVTTLARVPPRSTRFPVQETGLSP
ncbi:ankyrin repeat-containing protein [Niveomyces insectorum RCEF 264]|uniref:Ankyrin repeat-containing protein n=1 Tax=Niveomyces insectorum RCEF 264 TaxID=1081102 RepID=A0A167Z0Q4_9HYPO|nr:ankyrin repeat-containing protein [Niveomyces insectorum RCEF 264]